MPFFLEHPKYVFLSLFDKIPGTKNVRLLTEYFYYLFSIENIFSFISCYVTAQMNQYNEGQICQ